MTGRVRICIAQRRHIDFEVKRDGVKGTGNGHDRDLSVAEDDHILMTPGGQGLRAGVGQCPHAPKVEPRVLSFPSVPVEVGGEAVHTGT